jgi:hypothetical protein
MTDRVPDLRIDLDDEPMVLTPFGRQLRRTIMTTLTAAVAVGVLAYALTAAGSGFGADPPRNEVAAPASARVPAPTPYPRLVVPAVASAGDTVIVSTYRNQRLCGPTELRFDGFTIAAGTVPDTAHETSAFPYVFLSVRIPAAATAGRHTIELYGPMPSTGGMFCGDIPEHQGHLAASVITINPPGRAR